MSLAIRGNDFNFFFQCQRAKNRARTAKMDPKIDIFGQFDTRDLAIRRRLVEFLVFHSAFILGVKKVDFWTFSKLFWSCLGCV